MSTYLPQKLSTDIRQMIDFGKTYAEAEKLFRDGRIDQTDWNLYRFYWRNGTSRFSNVAAEFQLGE